MTHDLSRTELGWIRHVQWPTHALRNQQNPPMHAEKILVSAGTLSLPLAGCFALSTLPGGNGEILYTPHAGIKKFDSRATLSRQITQELNNADEEHELLAFMSLSARRTLAEATDIQVKFETIEGGIFEEQRADIENSLRTNDQAMIDELRKLPSLDSLLDSVLQALLNTDFPRLDQRQTVVNFYTETAPVTADLPSAKSRRWSHSMPLREAVLSYYRHQKWSTGQHVEFSHSRLSPLTTDQNRWQTAIKRAADNLIAHLSMQLQHFWSEASADGDTRRAFFSRAIAQQARADLLLKREAETLTAEQSRTLQRLIDPIPGTPSTLTLETVRLWEYPQNYVELAGSLMISQNSANAFLYTPAQGFELLKDYQNLKTTLQKRSTVAGHDDELYDLMSLEERQRFIGFEEPQVSGSVTSGSVFATLFEAIIVKQLQNLEYAFQVFRHSDGQVNIQAYFDKALDIRSMINAQLPTLEANGRWSTRPVLAGEQPSLVLADTAESWVKTFRSVESPLLKEFAAQPVETVSRQRAYLANVKPKWANALSVGVRGEATLLELAGKLQNADWVIIDTVFNPDRPDRKTRAAIKGFHPDAFSLVLQCGDDEEELPLANCILLTARGGLDEQHSGRAILWTPTAGLEVFETVGTARQQLNLRLLDARRRLLLENISPAQRKFHRRYSLKSLRVIEGDVLQYLAQSAIEHFLGRCVQVRSWRMTATQQTAALKALAQTVIDTNLRRATAIAQGIIRQQTLPAWLGMAPVEEQQRHAELLQQLHDSAPDNQDYLHGIKPLRDYVAETLRTLLSNRFPGTTLTPDDIEITPNLSLVGPAQSLVDFALNHVNVAQGTGFKMASKTTTPLPDGLDSSTVKQLLLSLDIHDTYAKQVANHLLTDRIQAVTRWQRFVQQVPWQLLHHAHELKLQQRLSAEAFDLIRQVLDMPDAVARGLVEGARAIARPLQLIKIPGTQAVEARGLYLIGAGSGPRDRQVLYAPYHTHSIFTEFENEASVVAAFNTPGPLQQLLLRRLPDNEYSAFHNLYQSTIGRPSPITLGRHVISGNFLTHLFNDSVLLLPRLLASRTETNGFADWEAVKHLFSSGIKMASSLLPGKLAYGKFLWQAYEDFKGSAEGLQDHHWKVALRNFINGTAQMVSLGRLSLEPAPEAPLVPSSPTSPVASPMTPLPWTRIQLTSPRRTVLQHFETASVQLKDLDRDSSNGTYKNAIDQNRYAPIAGKVYAVKKTGAAWRMVKGEQEGHVLLPTADKQLIVDPDIHTLHYGKNLSKMHNRFVASHEARSVLNIEARGMADIREKFPERAAMLVQAIDLARYYAFNSLHNLALPGNLVVGTRLHSFLKEHFDVSTVDASLIKKIKDTIVPVCNALVDPDQDLLSGDRLVIGTNKNASSNVAAFVNVDDPDKRLHITEQFFDQQLDWYKSSLTEPFDVDTHGQAAVLIHELAHLATKAVDIVYVEARRPFSDLVETITGFGQAIKQDQIDFQRNALSLRTPREELFARWNSELKTWISLGSLTSAIDEAETILEITSSPTMEQARNAFLDVQNAEHRINIILCNADSIARLICEMGRQLDPLPVANA